MTTSASDTEGHKGNNGKLQSSSSQSQVQTELVPRVLLKDRDIEEAIAHQIVFLFPCARTTLLPRGRAVSC